MQIFWKRLSLIKLPYVEGFLSEHTNAQVHAQQRWCRRSHQCPLQLPHCSPGKQHATVNQRQHKVESFQISCKKCHVLNHLFQPLVDNTGSSHISKSSSSSVAVTALCLSSDEKIPFWKRFENNTEERCLLQDTAKLWTNSPSAVIAPSLPAEVRRSPRNHPRGSYMCTVHTLFIAPYSKLNICASKIFHLGSF